MSATPLEICTFENLTLFEWVNETKRLQEEIEHLNLLLDNYIPLFYL